MTRSPHPLRPAAVGLLVSAAMVIALTACGASGGGAEAAVGDVPGARIRVDAEFGATAIAPVGSQVVWLLSSSGWDPCPALGEGALEPEICWIRVMLDETQLAVLFPEPEGTLGPLPLSINFDVFDIAPGPHELRLVQTGRLEIRETSPVEVLVRATGQ